MANQTFRDKMQGSFAELKSLRDQIGLDLHLASMELRSEWQAIEKTLSNPAEAVDHVKDVTTEAVEKLCSPLRTFRDHLRPEKRVDTVSDNMTRTVATCVSTDSLATVLATMWDKDIGALPVVDKDGRLAGMITDRDAAIAAFTQSKRMDEIPVVKVMSKEVISCHLDDPTLQALAMMESHKLRRLPVVNTNGKLEGIITLSDAGSGLMHGANENHSTAMNVVRTLLAISEKRKRSSN